MSAHEAWCERSGTVTNAFDQWLTTDREIRAFLDFGTLWLEERYEQIWNSLAAQPGDESGPELPDLFQREVKGLWPSDFQWMLRAAVVKDAVTAFEVYLDAASCEVLQHHGCQWKLRPGRSPDWPDLVRFFTKLLGVDVATDSAYQARDLRHALTHQRGELRTPELRERFGRDEWSSTRGGRATLAPETIMGLLDDLAAVVRHVDPVAWQYSWGGERLPRLGDSIGR